MMRRIIDPRLADCDRDGAMEIGKEHMHREAAGGVPQGYAAVSRDEGGWEINLAWSIRPRSGSRAGRNRWISQSAKVVPA